MTTMDNPVPSAPTDLASSVVTAGATSKRGPSWLAVVAVAVASAGGGVIAGWRARGAPASEPAKAAPDMAGMAGMASDAPGAPPGASASAVYISPGRQQLVGVRTALVADQRVEGTVRTVGLLAY